MWLHTLGTALVAFCIVLDAAIAVICLIALVRSLAEWRKP